MTKKTINLKLVGVALLPALAVSVAVILLGQAVGFSLAVAERISRSSSSFPCFSAPVTPGATASIAWSSPSQAEPPERCR